MGNLLTADDIMSHGACYEGVMKKIIRLMDADVKIANAMSVEDIMVLLSSAELKYIDGDGDGGGYGDGDGDGGYGDGYGGDGYGGGGDGYGYGGGGDGYGYGGGGDGYGDGGY